jgi:predicted DNA-binding ribbon-helix-helix protein
MCRVLFSVDSSTYEYETRSVRLAGHVTSIRLEAAFWAILEEIAAAQNVSLGRFLTKLHDEVLEFEGEAVNFSSLLRCACLNYVAHIKPDSTAMAALTRRAGMDFAGRGSRSGRA